MIRGSNRWGRTSGRGKQDSVLAVTRQAGAADHAILFFASRDKLTGAMKRGGKKVQSIFYREEALPKQLAEPYAVSSRPTLDEGRTATVGKPIMEC